VTARQKCQGSGRKLHQAEGCHTGMYAWCPACGRTVVCVYSERERAWKFCQHTAPAMSAQVSK
jgi:hypothetical protein